MTVLRHRSHGNVGWIAADIGLAFAALLFAPVVAVVAYNIAAQNRRSPEPYRHRTKTTAAVVVWSVLLTTPVIAAWIQAFADPNTEDLQPRYLVIGAIVGAVIIIAGIAVSVRRWRRNDQKHVATPTEPPGAMTGTGR